MRLRAACLLGACVAGALGAGDDCNPALYLSRAASLARLPAPTKYCSDAYYAGWGVTFTGVRQCIKTGQSSVGCPCHCYCNIQEDLNGGCWSAGTCASRFDSRQHTCFSTTSPCAQCDALHFNDQCGCQPDTASDALPATGFRGNWKCSPGSCVACPAGMVARAPPDPAAPTADGAPSSPFAVLNPETHFAAPTPAAARGDWVATACTYCPDGRNLTGGANVLFPPLVYETQLLPAGVPCDASALRRRFYDELAAADGRRMGALLLAPDDVTFQFASCVAVGAALTPSACRLCALVASTVGSKTVPPNCRLCPAGTYAAGAAGECVSCPAGTYAPGRASAECAPCAVPQGQFYAGQLSLLVSDGEGGFRPPCEAATGAVLGARTCTACTAPSADYTDFSRKWFGPTCPEYQPDAAQLFDDGTCRACRLCGGLRAAAANGLPLYAPSADGTACVADAGGCAVAFLDAATGAERGPDGGLPFVHGRRRVPGAYSQKGAAPDRPARYEPCEVPLDQGPWAGTRARAGAHPLLDAPNASGRLCVAAAAGCAADCDPSYVQECLPGHFAALEPGDGRRLRRCAPCPPHSQGGGGLQGFGACVCEGGYAPAAALRGLADGAVVLDDSDAACRSCAAGILAPDNATGALEPEAVSCPHGAAPARCAPARVLDPATQACAACPDGRHPLRGQCAACPVGHRCPQGALQACDGADWFQPDAGQAQCLRKVRACNGTQVLVYNDDPARDNACEPCPTTCEAGLFVVFGANRTDQSNPCRATSQGGGAAGVRFSACWPQAGPGSKYRLREADAPGVRLTFNDSDAGPVAFLEPCPAAALPPRAAWVQYTPPQAAGLGRQCYFACRHGVGASAAAAQRAAVEGFVRGSRRDLVPFLVQPWAVLGDGADLRLQVAYGTPGTDNLPPDPRTWQTPLLLKGALTQLAGEGQAQFLNTFLYVDGAGAPPPGLCLDPQAGVCPAGYYSNATSADCALLLHQGHALYRAPSLWGQPGFAIVARGGAEPACVSFRATPEAALQGPLFAGCAPCQGKLQTAADDALRDWGLFAGPVARASLDAALTMLLPRTWSQLSASLAQQPYAFSPPGQCAMFACDALGGGLRTWVFAYTDARQGEAVRACVPCEQAASDAACATQPGFHFAGCPDRGGLGFADVCTQCNGDALPGVSGHLQTGGLEWLSWASDAVRLKDDAWTAVADCRYTCRLNYTSSRLPAEYRGEPCVPCPAGPACDVTSGVSPAAAWYQSNAQFPSGQCGAAEAGVHAFAVFSVVCAPCQSLGLSQALQFHPPPGAHFYASNPECRALCDRATHFTWLQGSSATDFYYGAEPVRQDRIGACVPCTEYDWLPCNNNGCLGGMWWTNASVCAACTAGPCPVGRYREECPPGSTRDAGCALCPDGLLYEDDPPADALPDVAAEVRRLRAQGRATRQWVPCPGADAPPAAGALVLRAGRCCMACANNLVLLNATSGVRPAANGTVPVSRAAVCVPCTSKPVLEGLEAPQGVQLYSVWNASAADAPAARVPAARPASALARMQGQRGACYECAGPDYDTTTLDPTLCNLRAGAGTGADFSVVGIVTPLLPPPQEAADQGWGLRRRLLALAPSTPARAVRVYRQPALRASAAEYFPCCVNASGSDDELQRCRELARPAFEAAKRRQGAQFLDYCASAASSPQGRRLLQGAGAGGPCPSGQYKPDRGDAPCRTCPAGATTGDPWNGLTDAAACQCMPGYRAVRANSSGGGGGAAGGGGGGNGSAPAGNLLRCDPCGAGFHRPPGLQPDDACLPCPNGTRTPAGIDASTHCYCAPGTFRWAPGVEGCEACPAGHYCEGGASPAPCPDNSDAPPGARARGECACRKGYFGVLDAPGQACFPAPPGLRCGPNATATVDGGCRCPPGWVKQVRRDDGAVPAAVRAACVVPCAAGERALLLPDGATVAGCAPCPPGTYSAGPSAAGNCTPCPPGTSTVGGGAAARADCLCAGETDAGGECRACRANTFLRVLATGATQCVACPEGLQAPPGSVGPLACSCAAGQRAVRGAQDGAWRCEPCPAGFFSASVGAVCTACPAGSTTRAPGQSSARACACAATGQPPRRGVCPA